MRIFLVLALVLSLLVTIFAVENNAEIEVTFLNWQATGSLALVLMITLFIGIGIGVMLMLPGTVRARISGRAERKRSQQLEAELTGLQSSLDVVSHQGDPTAEVLPTREAPPATGP